VAQRTERIRLGPCVAPIYMREPTSRRTKNGPIRRIRTRHPA